ncbi:DUF1285 domain-containing protein [Alteraurantiacibacter aquimixticola]|uniref:DUF1285 domain-containing protein n=1 Tax=Alteraurantiacibacter aquimixticola TaxID=2489173 RepID=A0A4T3F3M1_9SPHN|nr:DUF1285 domain-containing protein [Alteraurantiacibacter aquimixticola]TIX51813.1 DUF1285 domain-containing protein [Alteraurantiacibacter aquimixticola]
MPYEAPPQLADMSLADIARALEERRLPPIEKWNPTETLDSKMRIAADGTWFHEGSPISRAAMVRAFSTLLVREEDGSHALLTPQCRQTIKVEDAAFVAVDVQRKGDALAFRLNTDDLVLAGPDNPLQARGDAEVPAIYLKVRHGTEARVNRSTWLQLVDLAEDLDGVPRVSSQGATFPLVPQ